MEKRRHIAFAGASVAMVLLTAACGSNESTQGGSNVQPVGGSQTVGSGASAAAGAGADYGSGGAAGGAGDDTGAAAGAGALTGPAKELAVKADAKLGDIVTDSKGMTLYRFDKDTPEPAKSNCNDACATTWPPVPADDAAASAGIDASELGEVTRADGTKQLTLAGWPMYRYAKDTKAGDTNGQGVGGTWSATTPEGKKAGTVAADETVELSTSEDAKLGDIMVDGEGMTVYRFDKDTPWPMKTGCLGACLDKWKPVKAIDKAKVDGELNSELVTSFTRPDGTKQAAFDCFLLYTFTGDTKPGDTNGQGVGGTWFALNEDGTKAAAAS